MNSKENSIYLIIRRNTSLSDDFLGIRSGLRIWVVKSTSVDDYFDKRLLQSAKSLREGAVFGGISSWKHEFQ